MSGDNAVPGLRVRSRLVWFGSRGYPTLAATESLLRAVRANHPKADTSLIVRAREVAEKVHSGQRREPGEPYITHPVAVATTLAELGMTAQTLAAAILHDTVEDTDHTLERLRVNFGDEINLLVDGVTRLDKLQYGEAAQAETVCRMIIAVSKNVRVLVIKLGDRLRNAHTWKYVSAENVAHKAREALEIHVPLAHRLRMNTVKWELEDRSFKALCSGMYEEIEHMVVERASAREEYLRQVRLQIEEDLRVNKIKGIVTGRPKHYCSIYQKMIVWGKDLDDIYNLMALRVIVDTVQDCYAVFGSLHSRWISMSGRFKDYITVSKFNLYQSLHATVVGPGDRLVEIQIRIHEMHRMAEYGVAVHWRHKEGPNASGPSTPRSRPRDSNQDDMGWLRQLVDWQKGTQDPVELLDALRYETAGDQVYVFTPRGGVLAPPAGATPVDFAYAAHTEVDHRTVGARVNSRLASLDARLENGDTVEVFTSKAINAGPLRDWLSFVASTRARNKICSWFSKERREEAIEEGKGAIARILRKQNLPLQRPMSHETLMNVAKILDKVDIDGLYVVVGEGYASVQYVVDTLAAIMGGEDGAEETLVEGILPIRATTYRRPRTANAGVVVAGMDEGDVYIKLARCCTPMSGDPIAGFITRGSGVSVRRADCQNIEQLQRESECLITVS